MTSGPWQVRAAIGLLVASLLVGIVDTTIQWPQASDTPDLEQDGRFFSLVIAISAALTTLYALIIYFVARRHNWARLALLFWIVVSFIPYIIWWPEFEADPWWTWIGFGLASLLELVALALLFTGRASLWYATPVAT